MRSLDRGCDHLGNALAAAALGYASGTEPYNLPLHTYGVPALNTLGLDNLGLANPMRCLAPLPSLSMAVERCLFGFCDGQRSSY